MDFDPDAPVDVLEPPVTRPVVKPRVFDPAAAVDTMPPVARPVVFHPDATVEVPAANPPLAEEKPGWDIPKGVALSTGQALVPSTPVGGPGDLLEKLITPSTVDPDKLWQTAKNPGARMRALYLKFFGSNAAIRTDFAPTPMIGSEAAGTKGGLVTLPAAEGTGKGAGLINAANKFSAGLTSPENVALLFGTEGAGILADLLPATRAVVAARVAQTATLGSFTALGAKDTVQAVSDVQQVLADPKATDADKADALATAFLSGGVTALAGKGTKDLAGKIGEKPAARPSLEIPAAKEVAPKVFSPEETVEPVTPTAAPIVAPAEKPAPVSAETPSVSAVQKFEPEAPVETVPETKAPEVETTVKAPASRYAGVVYEGEHHQDTYNQIRQATGRKMNMDDPEAEGIEAGFVTSTGRFVSREEAYKIARAGGQIKRAFGAKPELLNEAMKGEPRLAPATFGGIQEGARGAPGFDFYTLDEDIAGHPKGSSVTGETLTKAGYKLPEKPALERAGLDDEAAIEKAAAEQQPVKTSERIKAPTIVEDAALDKAAETREDKAQAAPDEKTAVDIDVLTAQQTETLKKMSESKLLALTKQLDLDPKNMSGDRLRARIQSNAHPEDIADALKGRGLISGSEAEKWADAVLKKKRGQLNAGIDPEQFAAYTVKGVANMERGLTDFAKWSAEMVRELGNEIKPHLVRLYRAAKELHEEGAKAATASPEELKDYVADFRNTPDEAVQRESAKEATPASRTASVMSALLRGEHPDTTGALKGLAGESAPKTSTLNEPAGDALVRYASAQIAAPEIAKSYAGRVLGEHLHDAAFAQKLGAVLNEDRLRTIKAGFLKQAAELKAAGDAEASAEMQQRADQVTSMVGLKDSPLKTEADFKAALVDPEIKAAVERHKELVQPFAEKMHVDLGGRTAKPGQNTGAFVNLLPIDEEGTALRAGVGKGGATGDFTTPFKKGSAFNKKSFGSAANYVTDYNEIVKAMITGNFTETAKRTLYDKLQEAGLGAVLPPGEEPPSFNGQPARKIQIERRGLGGRTIVRNLWVDRRIYPELVRGMGLDETFKNAAMTHFANVLNTVQIKGPVDGVAHVANILTSISGSQGGKTVVTDLIRRFPGTNVLDAMTRVFLRARNVVKDSSEIRQELAKVAEIGASRSPHEGAKGLSKLIIMVDKAARLVRNDMYDNLVARGWAQDSEAGRREFINQVGQYNSRLMGQMTAKFKEWGLSPFVVAGQNFNRNALRRVTATPGVRAASTEASVKLRAVELAGLAATLVAVPMAINYALSGKPQGRPGTPFGAIDTGKTTDDGKAVIVDPQQWTGVRRGLRLTGINAALSSQQRGDTAAHTVDAAARDIIGGFIHPFAGPAVNTALTAATGYNAAFFRQAPKAAPGESQMAQNAVAAAKQLNPFVGNAIEGLQNDSSVGWGLAKGLTKPFASAAGIKTAAVTSSEQAIQTKATQFNDTLGIARYEGGRPSDYVDLTKAIRTENYEHAADALQTLIQRKAEEIPGNMTTAAKEATARREVVEYYRRKAQAPFTGSLPRERTFKATLDADEQATYDEARAHYRQMAQSVRRLLYGQ